ncbi:MAG: V-type ATPase subunit, partial [Hadesarchaea archaeon]|nr:V-type ATPase subunit [Hadesarchaea archaeon]
MTSVIMLQLIPQVPSNIEYVILIGIILGLSVIAITFLYRYVRRVGAYAYASARVNARKRTLLRGDRLDSLVQSRNVENLISLLGDTPYSKYIGEVGKQKTIELEQSFKKHLADTYVDISRFAPIEIKGIFETILTRFDIQNLRVLFAGVHAGLPSEEIKKKVIPYGNLDMDIFDRSLKSEEFSAAVSVFEETEYWPPISEKLSEFQDTGNLLPLESELEKYYWRKVWSKIRRS